MIKLLLTDVDGCMTDGSMYYTAAGDELKRFCVYDGMGIVMLRKAGVPCGILTSETTEIVRHRARKLGLEYLYMGVGRQKDHGARREEVHIPLVDAEGESGEHQHGGDGDQSGHEERGTGDRKRGGCIRFFQ